MPNRISNDFTSTIAGSVFTKGGEDIIKPPVGHEFVGFTTLADTVLYSKPDFTYPSGQTFYERKDFMQVETGNIIAYYGRVVPKSKVKKILNEFTGAAAAYSLRELSNEVDNVVRVRRSTDNSEKDFTAVEVTDGTLVDFCNAVNEPLPADYGSGAAAAYSLRYVSANYSGGVVRVRRSSDSTEQDFNPTEITDGTLIDFVGASNDGLVTTWYDQSGNANNATQTSASQQPKIVDSGSLILDNGKPIIQNLSGAGLQVDAPLTNTSPVTQFSVAKIEGTRGIFSTYRTTGDRFVLAAESGSTNTSVFSDTPTSIFQDGSSYTVTNRGTLYNDSTSQSLFTIYWSSPNYQEFDKIGFTSGFWQMWSTQELIIYNSDQTANRGNIEANINSYYDIYTANTDGFVTSWYDQSGNGNTATQTSASAQGKIVDAGSLVTINSKPAIQSSGAEYMDFTATTTVGFSSKSIFAVTSFEQTDTVDRFLCSESSDLSNESQILTGGQADNRVTFATQSSGTNYNSDYIIMAQDDLSLLTGIFDGSSTEIYLDGVLGTGTSYKSHSNAIPASGYLWSKNGTANFWIGKHCEIIIYTTDESSNQSDIENNIKDHYSI